MANSKSNVKATHLHFYVEDIVADAFQALVDKQEITLSSYVRNLVLRELREQKMLPDDTLLRLASAL